MKEFTYKIYLILALGNKQSFNPLPPTLESWDLMKSHNLLWLYMGSQEVQSFASPFAFEHMKNVVVVRSFQNLCMHSHLV